MFKHEDADKTQLLSTEGNTYLESQASLQVKTVEGTLFVSFRDDWSVTSWQYQLDPIIRKDKEKQGRELSSQVLMMLSSSFRLQ
jgi:hypothetical protein